MENRGHRTACFTFLRVSKGKACVENTEELKMLPCNVEGPVEVGNIAAWDMVGCRFKRTLVISWIPPEADLEIRICVHMIY